jgi:hypothetical protein
MHEGLRAFAICLRCLTEYCLFEHLPNTSGRTEDRTLTVISERERRRPLVGHSGKHVTAIPSQRSLYYCVCVFQSTCFLVYLPYFEKNKSRLIRLFCSESVSILPFFARQRLGKHVPAATNTHATIEKLLDSSLSMWQIGDYFFQEFVVNNLGTLVTDNHFNLVLEI